MQTREEAITFCMTLQEVYKDMPFHDQNWTLMRQIANKKVFAWIFEKDGHIWINVKCNQEWREFWRNAYPSVLPGFHMNKEHWNSIILDGTIPEKEIKRMIEESYDLIKVEKKTKQKLKGRV